MKSFLKITVYYIFQLSQVLFSQPDWDPGFILTDSIYSLKKDITLVMISHRLSTLSYCEKIVEIKNKKIYLKANN